jgi:hypothetical protein
VEKKWKKVLDNAGIVRDAMYPSFGIVNHHSGNYCDHGHCNCEIEKVVSQGMFLDDFALHEASILVGFVAEEHPRAKCACV